MLRPLGALVLVLAAFGCGGAGVRGGDAEADATQVDAGCYVLGSTANEVSQCGVAAPVPDWYSCHSKSNDVCWTCCACSPPAGCTGCYRWLRCECGPGSEWSCVNAYCDWIFCVDGGEASPDDAGLDGPPDAPSADGPGDAEAD